MALPSSGTIWLSQIQAEFAGPNYWLSTYYRGAGYTTINNFNVPTAGAIYFSNFHGAQRSIAGSAAYTSPGTYTFYVPVHSSITFDARGAGGGGGGSTYDAGIGGNAGGNGETAYVNGIGLYATGGTGGAGSYYNSPGKSANGVGGGANNYVAGGEGGAGGAGGTYGFTRGGDGGDGGRGVSYWAAGSIGIGAALSIVVPSGGGGGAGSAYGAAGSPGAVYISWT